MEICSIISYYLDYRQDILLNNLKNHFRQTILKEALYEKLTKKKTNKSNILEEIKTIFRKNISDNIFSILPAIMKTGTSIDKTDLKFKDPINKSLDDFNLSNILGFDILPSLITIFCLNKNQELEKEVLTLITRFYNQRYEFAKKSSHLLFLFDKQNIQILQFTKIKIKQLNRFVDETEVFFFLKYFAIFNFFIK